MELNILELLSIIFDVYTYGRILVILLFLSTSISVVLFVRKKLFKQDDEKINKIMSISAWVACVMIICNLMMCFMLSYTRMFLAKDTATDVLYINDDFDSAMYVRLPMASNTIPPTLYINNFKHNITKRVTPTEDINGAVLIDDNTVIFSVKKHIVKYNFKDKKKEILYTSSGNIATISSLSFDDVNKKLSFSEIDAGIIYSIVRQYRRVTDPFYGEYKDDTTGRIYLYDLVSNYVKQIKYDTEKLGKVPIFPSSAFNGDIVFNSDDNILFYDTKTEKVSFLTKGYWPKISKNGKFIMFMNYKADKDYEELFDVYRFNIETKKTELISSNRSKDIFADSANFVQYIDPQKMNGAYVLSNMSTFMDISDDGNIVAYLGNMHDYKNSLFQKRINSTIYYYNCSTGITQEIISFEESRKIYYGMQTCTLKLSGNGRYLMFTANGLTNVERSGLTDIYVKDMQTGELTLLSDTKSTWLSPKKKLKI